MQVEILCTGNELIFGTTMNSNAYWLAKKISEAGGLVKRVTVVGDDLADISAAVKESLERKPAMLITTGGLGATYDDSTLGGVAKALGRRLVLDQAAVEMLKQSYARRSLRYELNQTRLKMATIPEGSVPIPNPVGSAPAVMVDASGTKIFCLPGVPAEMEIIFLEKVLPEIKNANFTSKEVIYDVTGVSEATIAPAILKIVESYPRHLIYLKTHPKGYFNNSPQLRIQIVSKGSTDTEVEERLNSISKAVKDEVTKLGGSIS